MRILLLGSTGSIGTSTLNCVRRNPERFTVTGLSALQSNNKITKQAREFNVRTVCVTDTQAALRTRRDLGSGTTVHDGADGLLQLVDSVDYDIMVNALVGAAGLPPTVAALRKGKRVALANKESLVAGGEVIRPLLAAGNGSIVPIDSEHSAILQCLNGEDQSSVESLILTASGGPFRELPLEQFATISPNQALRHPTWSMGAKITIDSATLVNKGFEVIEAHYLFDIPYERLRVWIHPQSIIHSLVEFHDGAVLAQLGIPDMEIPIQYALEYPRRLPIAGRRLDLTTTGPLTFSSPDFERFPCLRLCLEAGKAGGAAPVVLNAANEIAVQAFLDGTVPFTAIASIIDDTLTANRHKAQTTLEGILNVDNDSRAFSSKLLGKYRK